MDNSLTSDNQQNSNSISPTIWPGFGALLVEDFSDPIPLEELMRDDQSLLIDRVVSEIVRCQNVKDALEMIHRLRLVKNLNQTSQQMYRVYSKMLNLLKFVSLYAQKPREINNRLREGLVQAVLVGIEVKDRLNSFFYDERDFGPNKEQRKDFAHALEINQELVGQQLLLGDERKNIPPTVQNWLAAYNRSQPLYSERSKFNQINFLNADRQVQSLSLNEKKLLEEILEIYDWLLFPSLDIALIDTKELNEYVSEVSSVLPKDFVLFNLSKTNEAPDLYKKESNPSLPKGSLANSQRVVSDVGQRVESVKVGGEGIVNVGGAGLKFGDGNQKLEPRKPQPPQYQQTSAELQGKPIVPQAKASFTPAEKPGLNIDQKLEELKKRSKKQEL